MPLALAGLAGPFAIVGLAVVPRRFARRRPLKEFGEKYGDARAPLDAWYRILKGREYKTSHELRKDFPSTSFLGARRTVFNIGGNKYRLVVDMRYELAASMYETC